MGLDVTRDETFLFAFEYKGRRYAVAVSGDDHAKARARFLAMTPRERIGHVIAGLDATREPDAVDWIVDRVRTLFRSEARAA